MMKLMKFKKSSNPDGTIEDTLMMGCIVALVVFLFNSANTSKMISAPWDEISKCGLIFLALAIFGKARGLRWWNRS